MFHFHSCCSKLSLYSVQLMMGAGFVLLNHSIAASASANELMVNEIRLAQAQFTTDQLPSDLSSSSELQYGDSVRGRLNVSSIRYQGRLFSIYHFEGEAEQLIRINLTGGLASDRPPDRIQTGSLLINPAVILVAPNGEIIAQQPEQTGVANALIRMNLPMTGTYHIFVTSTTAGSGGQYTLILQQIEQDR